jgi:hypothetical protein
MTEPREILFVDPAIADLATISGNLRPGVEAFLLDSATPAARQIAAALAERRGLDAVHVIAHGAPGRVDFAAGGWSAITLDDEAEDLAAIGRALAGSGDLRLWSCETGAGLAGAAFVGRLAQASGAPVAAASGLVGAAAHGGSWQLTAAVQPPLTAAGAAGFENVLATETWTGATSTAWSIALSWSGTPTRVPIAGDSVVISGSPSRQPTLNVSSADLASLAISGANTLTMGAVTLDVADTTSSAITIGTGSAILITGGTITTGTAGGIGNTGTITNLSAAGTISGGAVTNNSAGVITVTSGILSLTGGALTNNGTINANGGILSLTGGALTNNGTINANGGILTDASGFASSNTNSGTIAFAGGSVNVSGQSAVLNNDSLITFAGGTLQGGSGGFVNASSAEINVNSGTNTLSVSGGTIANAGDITVAGGTLTASGGAVTNRSAGVITINAGTLSLTGGALTNNGRINANGGTLTDASGFVRACRQLLEDCT